MLNVEGDPLLVNIHPPMLHKSQASNSIHMNQKPTRFAQPYCSNCYLSSLRSDTQTKDGRRKLYP